jgi:hypothetical protein
MITFTNDLLNGFNPAYNDSIVSFNSSFTGITNCDVTIDSKTFTIYPFNNEFKFNFKPIVTTLINQNGFKDSVLPDLILSDFIIDDSSLQLTINPDFFCYNSTTGETMVKEYKFLKCVEQLPFYNQKVQANNDIRVLIPSQNGVDFNLTYSEGYPADFAIQGVLSGYTYHFRNSNTGIQSTTFTATTSDVKRIFLSDGATDTTIDGVMLLSSNINNIELWVNGFFKCNIKVKKVESKCGVYLKWFNSNGGYSYWLFDKFFNESLKTKDFEDINGAWDNLQNVTSTYESLGKSASSSLVLNTQYNSEEKEYLLDLLKSPKVEMYINNEPFIQQNEFNFIGVKISDGSFTYNNSKSKNKLKVTIELPNTNTITY